MYKAYKNFADFNIIFEDTWTFETAAFDFGQTSRNIQAYHIDIHKPNFAEIIGTAENDFLQDTAGDDIIRGLGGDDHISAYLGNDQLYGGDGDDYFLVQANSRATPVFSFYVSGGEGNDTLEAASNYEFDVEFDAGTGDDIANLGARNGLEPENINFTINMGEGTDTVNLLGKGNHIITLGSGIDRVIITEPNTTTRITDFATGTGGDIFEFKMFKFTLGWDWQTNLFDAGYFALEQRGSDTVLTFDLDGTAGSVWDFQDFVVFENTTANSFTNENLQGLNPTGGILTGETITGTNNTGDMVGDTLIGTSGGDTIFGLAGDDRIEGGYGNDELHGGDGNDNLVGGFGEDILYGGAGDDYLVGHNDGGLSEYNGEGIADDELHGGDGNDTLIAHTGNTVLYGDDGDDYLTPRQQMALENDLP